MTDTLAVRRLAGRLAGTLAACGTDAVFGTGGLVPGLRHHPTRDAAGAVHAARAYAALQGAPGVVVVEGAQLRAALPAIAGPVLVVSIDAPEPVAAAVACLAERSDRIVTTPTAAAALAAAYAGLGSPIARPVHIDLPHDLLTAEWPAPAGDDARAGHRSFRSPGTDRRLAAAAARLAGAHRPLIFAGAGALTASGPITTLAEEIGAPLVTTVAGKGAIDEGHPLALGATAGLAAIREEMSYCDVVVVVGSDGGQDGMPVAALDVDALGDDPAATVAALSAALPARHARMGVSRAADLRASCRIETRGAGGRYEELADALRGELSPDTLMIGDGSAVTEQGAVPFFQVTGPRLFHRAPGGAIAALVGAGAVRLPALPDDGLGAEPPSPRPAPVAALLDVAEFVGGVAELASVVDQRTALPIVVVDHDQAGFDIARMARACGAEGVRAISPGAVVDAVADALELDRPMVIHLDWVD